MAEQIRTFIAIELEEAQRSALAQAQARLKGFSAGRLVRWVAPESIHLTIKFLGGVDAGMIPALERAVQTASAQIPPFDLTIGGIGAFPNPRRARVVWVGLSGQTLMAEQLAGRLEAECGALGFAREERPFSPHLTLGRVKRETRPSDLPLVGEMIEKAGVGELGQLHVSHVSIMKSDLRPTGSVYTQLAAIPLAP